MSTTRTAPTVTEEDARMVSAEARKQNGWEVLGIDFTHGNEGVIRFHREQAPHSGKHYGTAHFSIQVGDLPGSLVGFEWGHYDLSLDESRTDFASRVAQGR
jgi:hypothetical protein